VKEHKKGYLAFKTEISSDEANSFAARIMGIDQNFKVNSLNKLHSTTHILKGIRSDEVGALSEGVKQGLRAIADSPIRVGGYGVSENAHGCLLYFPTTTPEHFSQFDLAVRGSIPNAEERVITSEFLHNSALYLREPKLRLVHKLHEHLLRRIFEEISWEFYVKKIAVCFKRVKIITAD